jgi:hypothetical protein
MAGGTWNKLSLKERPGTYINFQSDKTNVVSIAERGTAIMPLLGHNYGPAGEFITIESSSPDAQYTKLGYSVYEEPMLLVKEMFKNAKTVILYIPAQGDKAKATVTFGADAPVDAEGDEANLEVSGSDPITLKASAMYGGERGNALSFDCTPNEDDDEAFDVSVYLDNSAVETFEGLKTIGDLIAAGSAWITFKGNEDAALEDFSAISLEGGTNGTVNTVDMTKFLDASEAIHWNTMAFPVDSAENSSLLTAAVSKIKYLRDDVGKYRKLVVANYAPDYEGVINVCNGYVLSDGTVVDAIKATAWVAGADAGADCVTSNTYKSVEDASDIDGLLTHTEAVAAIKAGKFFFSFNESNEVVVEYDINSLTTYGDGKKGKNWRKNRVLRVMDSFGESVQANFPPNRFDNDPDGWNIMEGLGKSILKLYGQKSDGGVGALKNIDYDNDFLVDREQSEDDETYFNCYIQPVDSSEKLYFTITTH